MVSNPAHPVPTLRPPGAAYPIPGQATGPGPLAHAPTAAAQAAPTVPANLLPNRTPAQLLEGRTLVGVIGLILFFSFVATALFVGRLAPAIGPVADTAQMVVRIVAIVLAVVMWFLMSLPVYRRRAVA